MPIGKPLSPVSIAGARRRQRRRGATSTAQPQSSQGNSGSLVKTAVVAKKVGPGAAVLVHKRNK